MPEEMDTVEICRLLPEVQRINEDQGHKHTLPFGLWRFGDKKEEMLLIAWED